MNNEQRHIIYSNLVEVEFYNQKENLFIQNHIADLVKHRLLPAMETLFDEHTSSGKKIKIDLLELDLGEINNKDWEHSFVDETIYKIRQKLNEIVSFSNSEEIYEVSYGEEQPQISNIHLTDEAINNLTSFLRSGILPWGASQQTAAGLLNIILEAAKKNTLSTVQKEKLVSNIFYADETLKRFILQFTNEALIDFAEYILKNASVLSAYEQYKKVFAARQSHSKIIQWLLTLLYSEGNFDIQQQYNTIIKSVLIKNISLIQQEVLYKLVKENNALNVLLKEHRLLQYSNHSEEKIGKENDVSEKVSEHKKKPLSLTKENTVEHFVNNAGLVILSPFLKQMFINLGLSTSKKFVSEETQARAVLLSHFLVTNQTVIAEHELLLNKIFCGFPIDKTLPSEFDVSGKEITQCNELLQSVLEYWKELKTTSVESLLNTYIIRNGKLVDKNEHWLLQVEYKSYDIMMQFLPWSIGIIYLPWMEKKLMVEWHA